jgi:hypothetical protein
MTGNGAGKKTGVGDEEDGAGPLVRTSEAAHH